MMGHQSGVPLHFATNHSVFPLERMHLMTFPRNGCTPTPWHTQVEQVEVVLGPSDHAIGSSLLSPGVPDRYHLRPDLGGHPPALQQQQHQDADSHPQQVTSADVVQAQSLSIVVPCFYVVSLSSPPPLCSIFTLRISLENNIPPSHGRRL